MRVRSTTWCRAGWRARRGRAWGTLRWFTAAARASRLTRSCADSGNESGAEGSLALVQALGYPLKDGIEDSVDDREIVIRYFPKSNPDKQFFKTQAELDRAAEKLGLKR